MNKLLPLLKRLNKWNASVSFFMASAGFLFLVGVSVIAVIMRHILKIPFVGAYDYTEVVIIVIAFFGAVYAYYYNRHVIVDIVVDKLVERQKNIVLLMGDVLTIFITAFLIWRAYTAIFIYQDLLRKTPAAGIPLYWFSIMITLCLIFIFFIIVEKFLIRLNSDLGLNRGLLWLILLTPSIAIAVGMGVSFSLELSAILVGTIGILLLFTLFATGIPVWVCMMVAGVFVLGNATDLSVVLYAVGQSLLESTKTYTWAALALFLFLGMFIFSLKFSEDMYDAVHKWMGQIPGGLAIATVGASAFSSAVVGDTVSSAAAMGKIALPEMKRYKYSLSLATGTIAASATIGTLIPPSLGMILYGTLVEAPIGALFMAGVIPGLLCAILFSVYIYFICRKYPSMGPVGPKHTFHTKIRSFKGALPIIVLIVLILGSIYGGIMTVVEAAASGAVGTILLGLVMGRINKECFSFAFKEATITCSMILFILAGAGVFSKGILMSGLPHEFAAWIVGIGLSPYLALTGAILAMLMLGCIMNSLVMMIILVPLFNPMLMKLGFDTMLIGVICVLMVNLGTITPPFGVNLFVLKGVDSDVPLDTIIKGVLPFVAIIILVTVLVVVFPPIATWLPGTLNMY